MHNPEGIKALVAMADRKECRHGHPWTPENTRVWRGRPECVTCHRAQAKRARAAARAKSPDTRKLRAAAMTDFPPMKPGHANNYATVPETGCWLWLGAWGSWGYGQVKINGAQEGAHRAFYHQFKGPIPPGLMVCHKCDTPACVNPDHLFLGSPTDNVLDMFKKGRARPGGIAATAPQAWKGDSHD